MRLYIKVDCKCNREFVETGHLEMYSATTVKIYTYFGNLAFNSHPGEICIDKNIICSRCGKKAAFCSKESWQKAEIAKKIITI